MKNLILLTVLILLISSVTVLAAQEAIGVTATATVTKTEAPTSQISVNQKNQFKQSLKSYFSPVLHGYGIGFTNDTYITAKFQISQVRILRRNVVNAMIREAKQGNNTDWDALRARVMAALEQDPETVPKGRIMIDRTNYVLANIVVSNTSFTADINEIPDYAACVQANTSAEDCENNANNVGQISISKKTKASQEVPGDPKVWAGTLTFNDVAYTFVTFAYPR